MAWAELACRLACKTSVFAAWSMIFFGNFSAPYESARHQNDNCRRYRSFPFRDQEVPSVHRAQSFWCYDLVGLSQDDKLPSCGLWMFQISTHGQLLQLETDEGISRCSWTPRESHNFFNFSHYKTPNFMFFRKISSWNEMFLRLNNNGNVYWCWIAIDSL